MLFFFFKQKTAYEMRISDWSSDVCSSDLLAADTERAALLAESETCHDPDRLGDIHDRLIAIDAYSAPARAGRILVGLGFDEEMQGRPLDSYSGGWKMRVALGALLRSEEHTSELQSLMRISYAVFCLKKKKRLKTTYL